jgi:hypothetical protein
LLGVTNVVGRGATLFDHNDLEIAGVQGRWVLERSKGEAG